MFVDLSNEEYAELSKQASEQSPRQLSAQYAGNLIRDGLKAGSK